MVGSKVALGALWLVGAKVGARALDLVSMLVVARILTPADFGLFALAASIVIILEAVSDLSLANAIVQMPNASKPLYDSAFTLNLIRGVFLCAVLMALAYPFAVFYEDPRLVAVVMVLSIAPLVRGLMSPKMAQLQRDLQFRPQFFVEFLSTAITFIVTVILAFVTRSYWTLVAGMIATPAAAVVLSYLFAPYRPAFGFHAWRSMIEFSGWLTLGNGINALNWQADRFFIGGWLGTSTLGTYTIGNTLASLPTNAPILPIMQALYAGLAKIRDDAVRFNAAYLVSQAVLLALALPISLAVAIFARPIIMTFMGEAWTGSIIVVQILAPVLAFQMLTAPAQSVAMAMGRTRELFKRDLLMLVVRLMLIVAGLFLGGFMGILWARIFSGLFIVWQNMLMISRIIDVSVLRQSLTAWRSYVAGVAYSAILIAIGDLYSLFDKDSISNIAVIGSIVIVAGVMYVSVHLILWSVVRPVHSAEEKIFRLLGSRLRPAGKRIFGESF